MMSPYTFIKPLKLKQAMYIPKHFNVTDKEEIFAFIKANPFGQLISLVEARFFSTHLPFLMGKKNQSIICHIAKSNPQWKKH